MVELTSLNRDFKQPHLKIVQSLTDACGGRCKKCYVPFAGKRTSLAFWAFKENILPYLQKVSPEKPHITLVGGEPCFYRHFLPITEAIIGTKPEKLDIFTNGALFAKTREEFWQILKKGGDSVSVVFSYDRHHAEGVPQASTWLEEAFRHFGGQWNEDSRTGFVISSTRFSDEPEKEIDSKIHSLAAKYRVPIKVEVLDWENVFSWAGKFPLRIEVPQFNAYFELKGIWKHNGKPIRNHDVLTFSYQPNAIYASFGAIGKDVHYAEKQYYMARQYPFRVEVVGAGDCNAHLNSLEIEHFLGTDKKKLLEKADYPKNQLYIHHDGWVYENPIALAQEKSTIYNILTDSLEKIARALYPEKEN